MNKFNILPLIVYHITSPSLYNKPYEVCAGTFFFSFCCEEPGLVSEITSQFSTAS